MSGPIVETEDLRKTYFGKVEVPVLHGLNLRIDAGEFVAIVGQSGSGKSTLLNILGCLDRATGGTVRIAGEDVSLLNDNELADLRSERVGFIFQAHFLLDEFTCLENALMPISIRHDQPNEDETAWVRGLLDRVGLSPQLNQTPDTMSGGQNQRCAIVRALANRPNLVLADEPTGNLDSRSGREVFNLMREMNRDLGVAFVMVTHDDRLAEEADRILQMEDGYMHEIPKQPRLLVSHR